MLKGREGVVLYGNVEDVVAVVSTSSIHERAAQRCHDAKEVLRSFKFTRGVVLIFPYGLVDLIE